VFSGGWNLEAAEAVCSDLSNDLMAGLGSLVDQSLLRRDDTADDSRFTMLETIREYGYTLLAERGEVNEAAARHAAYFLGVIDTAQHRYTTEQWHRSQLGAAARPGTTKIFAGPDLVTATATPLWVSGWRLDWGGNWVRLKSVPRAVSG